MGEGGQAEEEHEHAEFRRATAGVGRLTTTHGRGQLVAQARHGTVWIRRVPGKVGIFVVVARVCGAVLVLIFVFVFGRRRAAGLLGLTFVAVVELPADEIVSWMGETLAATLLSDDATLRASIAAAEHIDHLHADPVPTTVVRWAELQRGNLFRWLYAPPQTNEEDLS